MRVYQGKYGKDTQMSNALVVAQNKYPEICRTMILQDKKYSMDYVTEGLSNIASIGQGDTKYRWPVKGRRTEPSTTTGTYSGTGASNAIFTSEFYENYFNPGDIIRYPDGTQAIILDAGTASALGFTYQQRINTDSTSTTIASTNFTAGQTVGKIGTVFPEASETGYGELKYPDWYENYMSISRKSLSVSGSYLTDITWIENNGQKLWFFTHQKDTEDQFKYEKELKLMYGVKNVDVNGNVLVSDLQGRKLQMGDGYVAQVDANNIDTYTTLTESTLVDYIYSYKEYAGLEDGATVMAVTATGGYKRFEKALKDYYVANANVIYNVSGGGQVNLGTDFRTYHVAGLNIQLSFNPIKDDKQIFSATAADGFTKESCGFDFMYIGDVGGGKNNLQKMVKSAGGIDRGSIVKYIPGMVNPFDQESVLAARPDDKFEIQWLAEEMVVVHNPKTCGRLLLA